jgi:hypothetical protein
MGRPRALVILLATLVLVGPVGLRSAAAQTKTARGTVVTVSDASLTVKAGARVMTFVIDQGTAVLAKGAGTKTRRAQDAGAPGIKLSDAVTTAGAVVVTYRETNGVMLGRRLDLRCRRASRKGRDRQGAICSGRFADHCRWW